MTNSGLDILDDFSRYIIAWKLCTTMRVDDVTDTLKLALEASGCDSAEVVHKPLQPPPLSRKPQQSNASRPDP